MVYRDPSWTIIHGTCMIIHGMILVFDIIVGGISLKVLLAEETEYQGTSMITLKSFNLKSKIELVMYFHFDHE